MLNLREFNNNDILNHALNYRNILLNHFNDFTHCVPKKCS